MSLPFTQSLPASEALMNHHITAPKVMPLFEKINAQFGPSITFDICQQLIEFGSHITQWSYAKPNDTFTFEDPAFALDMAKSLLEMPYS